MTDRVRLLLEDGTVLAEGVRAATEYEDISNETFETIADVYAFESLNLRPVEKAWIDWMEEMCRRYAPGGDLYWADLNFNAVIKL